MNYKTQLNTKFIPIQSTNSNPLSHNSVGRHIFFFNFASQLPHYPTFIYTKKHDSNQKSSFYATQHTKPQVQ